MRLFCFPPAGGATVQFFAWADALPEFEVHVAQLPGRERRRDEPSILEAEELLGHLTKAIARFEDRPAAFYGHSMGALVAFEMARRWREIAGAPPAHLFAAARRAPQVDFPRDPIHHLADDDFLWHLENRWGALPAAVRKNADLLHYFLPVIRADITLLETYHYRHDAALSCPITVYGGQSDPSTTRRDLEAWREQTAADFDLRIFAGDHFFPQALRAQLLDDIARRLGASLAKSCH